jgi:hypothetical protein
VKRAACAIAALALACSSDELTPVSVVDSLRVLAVRADLPIAEPGEKVHLDALVADANAGRAGRTVKLAWATCLNAGSQEVTACADAAGPFALGGAALDVVVPTNALDGSPTNPPLGVDGVLFAACAGDVVFEKTATSPVRCVANGADLGRDGFMWGEKRIVVARGVRNANPKIADVSFDGAPWDPATPPMIARCDAEKYDDCPTETQHAIAITATPDSAETYGQFTEDLVAFFFVSAGRVADDFVRADGGAFSTSLAAARADSGSTVTVWLVLRDDRGGVDWQLRSYGVR